MAPTLTAQGERTEEEAVKSNETRSKRGGCGRGNPSVGKEVRTLLETHVI